MFDVLSHFMLFYCKISLLCDLRCFVAKSVLSRFMRFYRGKNWKGQIWGMSTHFWLYPVQFSLNQHGSPSFQSLVSKGPKKHFHKSLSHVCLLASWNLNIWKGLYPTLKSAVCQAWESCNAVVALKQHNQRCRAWIQPSRVALKQHNQSDPAWIRPLPESQLFLFWNKTTSRKSPWLTVLAVKSKINCIVILLTVFQTQSDTNGIWKWW